jgi:hypothetical protein
MQCDQPVNFTSEYLPRYILEDMISVMYRNILRKGWISDIVGGTALGNQPIAVPPRLSNRTSMPGTRHCVYSLHFSLAKLFSRMVKLCGESEFWASKSRMARQQQRMWLPISKIASVVARCPLVLWISLAGGLDDDALVACLWTRSFWHGTSEIASFSTFEESVNGNLVDWQLAGELREHLRSVAYSH